MHQVVDEGEVVGFELGERQAKRVGDRQLGGDDVREGQGAERVGIDERP